MATKNEDTNAAEETEEAQAQQQQAPRGVQIAWDDSGMETLFANVVNASSTMEEFMLFFGMNQTWNPTPDGHIRVKLDQRVILSPHAAKRLSMLLNSVIEEYERRFGALNVEGRLPAAASDDKS